jgi:hypothetical protein
MTGAVSATAELEHRIGPNGRFALRMPAGTASIRAVDGDVVRVREVEGRSLAERFEIRRTEDALELVAKSRLGGLFLQIGSWTAGGGEAELAIEVPRMARVAVDVASADVSVTGVAGPGRFRTASGDLIIQDAGGNVEFEGVSADVRIEAVAAVELDGRTISGDASIRAPRLNRLEMTTTSGDIRIDADLGGKGPFAIRSISGDVTIVARGAIAIEAQTVTGDLHSDLPARTESGPGRRALTIGRGATPLAFKSVSGDLTVVEARDAAPKMPAAGEPSGAEAAPMPVFAAESAASMSEPGPEAEAARLAILRDLERGEIDVETAMTRLAEIEGA